MEAHVFLYTDGACRGNPGPGGYAAILQYNGCVGELTGGEVHTTNSRMELQAVIAGLQALKRRCQVTVVTDSRYVVLVLNNGQARANLDLVQQLRRLAQQHEVAVQTVRGHNGYPLNERADALARQAVRQRQEEGVPCAWL